MRVLTLTLAALIVLIQYPLWLGKGSWLQGVGSRPADPRAARFQSPAAGAQPALDAEVRDLKVGLEAIEERARSELGMITAGRNLLPGAGSRALRARAGGTQALI